MLPNIKKWTVQSFPPPARQKEKTTDARVHPYAIRASETIERQAVRRVSIFSPPPRQKRFSFRGDRLNGRTVVSVRPEEIDPSVPYET